MPYQTAPGGAPRAAPPSPVGPERPSWALFGAVAAAMALPLLFGASAGFTSPVFADCARGRHPNAMNCELKLTPPQKSLFAALINAGALAGALTGGLVLDPHGRRRLMIAAAALFVVAWTCITSAPEPAATATAAHWGLLAVLYAGRLLSGVAIGFTCCVVNVYVAEVAPAALRGALGTLFQVSIVLGFLCSYVLGVFFSWREMAALITILATLATALVVALVPESPAWCMQRSTRDAAAKALRTLRTPDSPIDAILDTMGRERHSACEGGTVWGPLLRAYRPLLVGVGLAVVQQLSGINAVMFYCGEILSSGFDKATANVAAVGVQVLHLATTLATLPLMDRVGRRPLLLTACVGMALCCEALGGYYHRLGGPGALPPVVAVLLVYGYVVAFAVGLGAIPWLIIGEIFPPESRGLGCSIATAVNWSMSFVVTKTLGAMQTTVGLSGVFWFYGGCLMVGLYFVYFCVPETKGRSLEDIQAAFGARLSARHVEYDPLSTDSDEAWGADGQHHALC